MYLLFMTVRACGDGCIGERLHSGKIVTAVLTAVMVRRHVCSYFSNDRRVCAFYVLSELSVLGRRNQGARLKTRSISAVSILVAALTFSHDHVPHFLSRHTVKFSTGLFNVVNYP